VRLPATCRALACRREGVVPPALLGDLVPCPSHEESAELDGLSFSQMRAPPDGLNDSAKSEPRHGGGVAPSPPTEVKDAQGI